MEERGRDREQEDLHVPAAAWRVNLAARSTNVRWEAKGIVETEECVKTEREDVRAEREDVEREREAEHLTKELIQQARKAPPQGGTKLSNAMAEWEQRAR